MALVTTPGAANANSYASLLEADAYFALRLSAAAWNNASEEDQEAALAMATRLLDAMPSAWTGSATYASTQALGFPRTGMRNRNGAALSSLTIPQVLKDATAEFAKWLLESDRTGDSDVVNLSLLGVKAGSVDVTFAKKTLEEKTAEMVPDNLTADPAGRLMVPDVVRSMLVPSWLLSTIAQRTAGNQSTLLFESLDPEE